MSTEISLNVGRSRVIQVTLEDVIDKYDQIISANTEDSPVPVLQKIINGMRCIPYDDNQALERAAIAYGHIYADTEGENSITKSISPGFKHPHWPGADKKQYYVAVDLQSNDHVLVWYVSPEGFDVINDTPIRMPRASFYSVEYDEPLIFHNLTQNKVTFMRDDHAAVTLDPEGKCKFFPEKKNCGYVVSGNPSGSPVRVPVVIGNGGTLTGLPPQEPGHAFIVSKMVQDEIKNRFPHRTDTFVTTGTTRDKEGRIIGCNALTRD